MTHIIDEKKSRAAFWSIILISCLAIIPVLSLTFDFNIEKLYPKGDKDVEYFRQFQQQFGAGIDDEYIFIGLENRKGIFQKDFLEKIDSLTKFLVRTPQVSKVYSLTNSNVIFFSGNEVNARPLIHINQPQFYQDDSIYLFESKEYRDMLVSKDGRSVAIGAFHSPGMSMDQKKLLIENIDRKIDEIKFDKSHVAAKIRVEQTYISEIKKNLKIYLLLSFSLIIISLLFFYRSFMAVLIPIAIIVITILWTMAIIRLTGHAVDVITSLIPPLLATISTSGIIHISTKYIEELRKGLSKQAALENTWAQTGKATFFTSLTTAIGFFTLSITNVIPIRHFGLFAGTGVMISYVVTIVFLFAYYRMSALPAVINKNSFHDQWSGFLSVCYNLIVKNKNMVVALFTCITLVAVFYAGKIEVNARLLQEIPRNNPLLEDYAFIESDFAGTRTFELVLMSNDNKKTFFQTEFLRMVEEIEKYLKDSSNVGYIISPVSLYKGANKAFHGGENEFYAIPASMQEVERYHEAIMQTEYADEMERYLLPDGNSLRISGRLPDLDIQQFKVISKRFDKFYQRKNYGSFFSYKLTGSSLILDKVSYALIKNLFIGLLIAFAVISIIVAALLKSGRMVLITLVCNIIPLLLMAAVMGATGIYLKADTAVIFAIAFGIGVDNSIHFISRFKNGLKTGLSFPEALKFAYTSVGKSMIMTTIVLLSGFLTLLSSSFGGSFYIGLLISVCLFFSLVISLSLLPILMLKFYR